MRPVPLPPPSPTRGGCCGCLFFPGLLALLGSSVFWLGGFSVGLLLHTMAALVWAATAALGHAFFGWRLPPLRLPERPSSSQQRDSERSG